MYTRTELLEKLHSGICEVIFEKVNGEIREMNCTLDAEHLPVPDGEKTSTYTRAQPEHTIAVWDVVKEDWRSFRIESVRQIKCLTGVNKMADLEDDAHTERNEFRNGEKVVVVDTHGTPTGQGTVVKGEKNVIDVLMEDGSVLTCIDEKYLKRMLFG